MKGRGPNTAEIRGEGELEHYIARHAHTLVTSPTLQPHFGQISAGSSGVGASIYSDEVEIFSRFRPKLKVLDTDPSRMDDELRERLRARGRELVENHDEAVIDETIEDVENLDDPESAVTADILRAMTGRPDE
jgi:hypothetical protein